MIIKYRLILYLSLSFCLLSFTGFFVSTSATLEELEKPQIPPPQLEKPNIQGFKVPNKGLLTGESSFLPNAISVDSSGNVFVSDIDQITFQRIIKYTNNGMYLKSWGKFGADEGEFKNNYGVDVDATGNVYVADIDNHRIQKFTSNGGFIDSWQTFCGRELYGPSRVAVQPASDRVFVVGSPPCSIAEYTNNGNYIKSWGQSGTGVGEFLGPSNVAVDSKDNIFVPDANNDRVQWFKLANPCPKFTSEITRGVCFVKSWGSTGTGNGKFNSPAGIGLDVQGNVFVSDITNHNVQKFKIANPCPRETLPISTPGVCFVKSWGTKGTSNGNFDSPIDLDVDPNSGNVFVVDMQNHRIQKFTNNGEFISKWFGPP